MLVLVVCAVGVGALYAVPGLGGASGQRSDPMYRDPADVPQSGADDGKTRPHPVPTRAESTAPDTSQPEPLVESPQGAGSTRNTAFTGDVRSPSEVSALRVEARRDRLGLRWTAAADDVGVTTYVVELNGYEVAETGRLSVNVPWFNTTGQQVVRVRARDAAGNVGQPSTLLVDRPDRSGTEPTTTGDPTTSDPGTAPRTSDGESGQPASEPAAEASPPAAAPAPSASETLETSPPAATASPGSEGSAS
jgi:septal ring-binding cell division protein DamX